MISHKNNNVKTDYFFGGMFKTVFLFIILAELFSLSGYFWPAFNGIAFFVIAGLALVLSLQKLEYGIYIVLAELFIGSKGYLFFFEHSGFIISIRIALWLIVMAVWAGKVIVDLLKNRNVGTGQCPVPTLRYFFILFIFITWGVISGILNHNEYSNIFFDFNNWLYFLLVFPIYPVILEGGAARRPIESRGKPACVNDEILSLRSRMTGNILQIFTAAIIWLCVKTFILLFLFSHFPIEWIWDIYRWVRVSGVGEITNAGSGFYRIFFQSHIFVLAGFFMFLSMICHPGKRSLSGIQGQSEKTAELNNDSRKQHMDSRLRGNDELKVSFVKLFCVLCSMLAIIIITFSRSFWVGLAFGILAFYTYLIWQKIRFKKILQISGMLIACAIASFILIFAIVKFPYPSSTASFSTSLISERASDVSEGAAVSSRWNLLPELWKEIKKAPVLGKGFGATVTYVSNDPRVLEVDPTGKYTTYAFEWGWLDIWLKVGLFGLLAYLVLIGKIIYDGVKLGIGNWELGIIFGLTIGLAVVAVVSIFSPYMNHPLGIGYLILVSAVLENLEKKKGPVN